MHKTYLLDGQQQDEATNTKNSSRKTVIHNAAAFSLGVALTYALASQSQTSGVDAVKESQSLWLVEPKNKYDWNQTTSIDWSQTSHFINVASSPNGDLYGIQKYGVDQNTYHSAYRFNFVNGDWLSFDQDLQIKDIKFDKLGNFYVLDMQNQLYAQNSKKTVILKNIQDYEITTQGQIYAISTNIKESTQQQQLNTWISGDGFQYKLLSPTVFSKLALKDEIPIYVDTQGVTVGYGYECVKDITVGVDGSVWALSCTQNVESPDFQLIKWDPFTLQWYDVKDTWGIKIAAYNEISISILDSYGRIRFSSEKKRYTDVKYYQASGDTQLFRNSTLLKDGGLGFVQSLLAKQYSMSILCYRASVNGWSTQNFHSACDFKGPTLSIIKSSTGKVAGGYTSQSWKSVNNYVVDKEAFLFSADNQVQITNPNGQNAIYDHVSYGPTFGGGHDLYVAAGANSNQNSYTNLNNNYKLPTELLAGNDPKTYLLGAYNFIASEIEVYYLI
ncbi:UNKNOWN [Stylonychia lemnae]|uniref:TLDc domain-containing protein n=1 Tax=Stylonychia lemnae TaxID=5949 RepID=A0A077ZVH2_STYLE|nr:UNKNOWN [Stylonychia lemnae]|eukprot:CDW73285.1 UNKNOWN [Stylonychia lemnae]